MKLTDYFNVLLKDTVNLSQGKLDLLDSRVEAVYKALKADEQIGSLILGKTPQGSWAHRTIINPVGSNEFDADFMLDMSENPDWTDSPKTYIEEVYAALHRHSKYGDMPHSRKCRCVRLVYANSMHIDIVPHLNLADGREVIVNRDDNDWELTDPPGLHRLDEEEGHAREGQPPQGHPTDEIPPRPQELLHRHAVNPPDDTAR